MYQVRVALALPHEPPAVRKARPRSRAPTRCVSSRNLTALAMFSGVAGTREFGPDGVPGAALADGTGDVRARGGEDGEGVVVLDVHSAGDG